MGLIIEQFICRHDNFGVLIHDEESGLTAAIDAPDAAPIEARLRDNNWHLAQIFVTHHHADHTDGIAALKADHGCTVTAPAREASKIPHVDNTVAAGDKLQFGALTIDVLETPGHTLGHVSYVIPAETVAFVADTLFSVGCGRVIEGTMEMMWASLQKLAALPEDTAIYCGHEYTEANVRFALTIEPDNPALIARAAEVKALRAAGKVTLPTTIGREKQTNPFLRADDPGVRARLEMRDAPVAAVFGEIRKRKDSFK